MTPKRIEKVKKLLGETKTIATYPDYTNIPKYVTIAKYEYGPAALEVIEALQKRVAELEGALTKKPCTCHPSDNPPIPCQRKYALQDCRAALAASNKDE